MTVSGSTPVTEPANYLAAFPNGFTASSNMYGLQATVQLPTRWFTVVASAYRGADLRFYAGGQFNTYATDLAGLTNPITFTTTDGGPSLLTAQTFSRPTLPGKLSLHHRSRSAPSAASSTSACRFPAGLTPTPWDIMPAGSSSSTSARIK